MIKFLKEKNMQIFMLLVGMLTVVDIVFWEELSPQRKWVNVFAIFAMLHEIEEKVWPGGFFELMMKKFGVDPKDVDLYQATSAVSVYWVVILSLPYIFHDQGWLLVTLIALSVFEAFVHTIGIKVHRMKKPYTPGLVTGWGLLIVAVAASMYLKNNQLVTPLGVLGGTTFMIVGFFLMDLVVLNAAKMSLSDVNKKITSNK